jgi:carbon dioxide concentrating mechanism protein CcmO
MESLALLEISNLSPSLIVADRCVKATNVRIVGIESTDGAAQCIKLLGSPSDVAEAAEQGAALAKQMGATAFWSVLSRPLDELTKLVHNKPAFSPTYGDVDTRVAKEKSMSPVESVGLLETQGLVAALHATDDMLKSASVKLVGKEKIGSAYVTIMIKGDVAAVQSAIATGKATVERLGGKLIMADVIARPHPDLAALLPA